MNVIKLWSLPTCVLVNKYYWIYSKFGLLLAKSITGEAKAMTFSNVDLIPKFCNVEVKKINLFVSFSTKVPKGMAIQIEKIKILVYFDTFSKKLTH